ncbi:MAG: sigma-70 family RNA polymerase sigma factor [Pseudomonadota bacterium]
MAFEQLVLRHQDRLLTFLAARLGRRADAQDAIQSAFVAAWRYRRSYKPRFRFSTWLYRIALREGARLAKPDRAGEPVPDLAAGRDPAADSDDLWSRARDLLGGEAFDVLWLYYHEDWPVSQIAQSVSRSRAWVKITLHRARGRLKKHLNPEDW